MRYDSYSDLPDHSIFPLFYFYRGRSASDRRWIESRLIRLGRENRISVCREYSNIYLRTGRDDANRFLVESVNKYGISKEEVDAARSDSSGDKARLLEKIERIKSLKPKARSEYGMVFVE